MNAWFQAWGDSWGTSWGPLHEVHDPAWDTSQGIAPNWVKFAPVKDAAVRVGSTGASAGSGSLLVETRSVTEVRLPSVPAFSGGRSPAVQAFVSTSVSRCSVRSGTSRTSVTSFALVGAIGSSASVRAGRVFAEGCADVSFKSSGCISGIPGRVTCTTVKNPTDEELIMMVMRTKRIDMQHANM